MTRLQPIRPLKLLWRKLWSGRPAAADRRLVAVVYRRFRGQLSILLLEDKRGAWSIPTGYSLSGEAPEAALVRLVRESAGVKDLKVWQPLGRPGETSPPLEGNLPSDCFLLQAMGGFEQLEAGKQWRSAAWLPIDEALKQLRGEDDARIVLIAAAKLKRAQI